MNESIMFSMDVSLRAGNSAELESKAKYLVNKIKSTACPIVPAAAAFSHSPRLRCFTKSIICSRPFVSFDLPALFFAFYTTDNAIISQLIMRQPPK